MAEDAGFAVYSEFQGGYLILASPSTYNWEPDSALVYGSPAEALAAAARRKDSGAIAVKLIRDSAGMVTHEALPIPAKAPAGTWIVSFIHQGGVIKPRLYVTGLARGGKLNCSTERQDARGFKHDKAQELVEKLNRQTWKGAMAELVGE